MAENVITPGNNRRVQVRKVRKGGFTEAKRQIFFDHLAGCCNVTAAAKAAGISVNTINYHKRRDPVFLDQWAEAIGAGYDGLEAMMIARAAGGGRYEPGDTVVPGAETVDPELALNLLKMRKALPGSRTGNGGQRPRRASAAELEAAITAKLDVLALRHGRAKSAKPAKSAAPGRNGAPAGNGAPATNGA